MLRLIKTFTTSTFPTQKLKPDWRTQAKQIQLISQISTTLLQTHTKNWGPRLKTLNLSSSKQLTPSLFLQILHKIQSNPSISLNFFNWATKTLKFQPDLKVQCKLTQILFGSGLSKLAKPILDSLIQEYTPTQVVFSLIQSSKGINSNDASPLISSVIECYCDKNMHFQALEAYIKAKEYGISVNVCSYNALLNVLHDKNELNLAWCLYSSMIRNKIIENQFTWSLISRILSKDGKFEKIVRILNMGYYSSITYDLVIHYYSKKGDFDSAFLYLNEMCSKTIDPTFNTYSSILNGACKYHDVRVMDNIMSCMIEKGLMGKEYDLLIQKFTDLGLTYAVEFFYKKACDEKVNLIDSSYGCMLKVLSNEGKVKEAINIYYIIVNKNIVVNDCCYNTFLDSLCKEVPSNEVNELFKEVIKRGFRPQEIELSRYVNSLCVKRMFRQVEEVLKIVIEKGFVLDSYCCFLLVKHYCEIKRIDLAIDLHNGMEKLECCFDVKTYSLFLKGLFRVRRIEEVLRVFCYIRRRNIVSSEMYLIMIRGLCHVKELREAMKLHDEMLKLDLKPDEKTYKRLISGFR